MKKGKKDKEKECYGIVMLPCISLCGGGFNRRSQTKSLKLQLLSYNVI